jgi:hypothetical protein
VNTQPISAVMNGSEIPATAIYKNQRDFSKVPRQ